MYVFQSFTCYYSLNFNSTSATDTIDILNVALGQNLRGIKGIKGFKILNMKDYTLPRTSKSTYFLKKSKPKKTTPIHIEVVQPLNY
jgi:hypothetical protein